MKYPSISTCGKCSAFLSTTMRKYSSANIYTTCSSTRRTEVAFDFFSTLYIPPFYLALTINAKSSSIHFISNWHLNLKLNVFLIRIEQKHKIFYIIHKLFHIPYCSRLVTKKLFKKEKKTLKTLDSVEPRDHEGESVFLVLNRVSQLFKTSRPRAWSVYRITFQDSLSFSLPSLPSFSVAARTKRGKETAREKNPRRMRAEKWGL